MNVLMCVFIVISLKSAIVKRWHVPNKYTYENVKDI
jgi:hypothetical protein